MFDSKNSKLNLRKKRADRRKLGIAGAGGGTFNNYNGLSPPARRHFLGVPRIFVSLSTFS